VSRRRPALALLLVLVLLTACATKPTPRVEDGKEMKSLQARAAYERGLSFLRESQPGPALSALQEAAALDPAAALYANTLGVVLLDQFRQIEGALAWLERAVTLDPTYGDAQLYRATALAEVGRWEDAVAGYRKALLLPTLTAPPVAHQNLGVALYNLKRYREAEESLRFALGLDPQMGGAYYNLGLVLLAQGRKDEARAAFRKVRDLVPESTFGQAAVERLKALGDGG
jgi:tetratricopeptide (TPR) repeat protein